MSAVKLVGTWGIPADSDAAEVDRYYFEVHVPNVRRIPGLRKHVLMKGVSNGAGGHPPFHRGAEAWFDSREDLERALSSPEWKDEEKNDGFSDRVCNLQITVYEVEEEWTN